ncbi:MAG: DUF4136 domain-containing protein [Acidobacteriota bacterium]
MKQILGFIMVAAIVAVPAVAQKVTIDYAHDFNFDNVKTFQYVDTPDSNTGNDLTNDRIRDAIIRELKEGGLQQVESNPDIFVTYHVTTEDNTVFNTTSYGYGGWGPGWGGYGTWGYGYGVGIGAMDTTTRAYTYTEGTLIIDAYNPADKKLIWRATGTVTVKAKPEKQAKQVDKILDKIGNQWEKILKNQGM